MMKSNYLERLSIIFAGALLCNPQRHGGGREGGGGEGGRLQNAGRRRVFCERALPAPWVQAGVEPGGADVGLPVPWVEV